MVSTLIMRNTSMFIMPGLVRLFVRSFVKFVILVVLLSLYGGWLKRGMLMIGRWVEQGVC